MAYVLKTVVKDRIFEIRRGGAKVGNVRLLDGGPDFIGFTTGAGPMRRTTQPTAQKAFEELVAILNRIELCGEDDPVKARQALAKRNREIEEQNAADWEALAPLREVVEQVTGRRVPRRRPRYTKIRI